MSRLSYFTLEDIYFIFTLNIFAYVVVVMETNILFITFSNLFILLLDS